MPNLAARTCWRCGAKETTGAPLSGCTEKRGNGPPWTHDYKVRGVDHPWATYTEVDLIDFIDYLITKTLGSLATATAFHELPTIAGGYAAALYDEKAAKRGRLLRWVVAELTQRLYARLSSDPIDYANLVHDRPFHLSPQDGCHACRLEASRKDRHADSARA